MKAVFSILAIALLISGEAYASKYVITCGEGSSRGPEHAEFAFVDDLEAQMHIYLKGELLEQGKFGISSRGGNWIVNVYNEPSRRDRQYVINEEAKTMQEFVLEKNSEKKVGRSKRCVISGP